VTSIFYVLNLYPRIFVQTVFCMRSLNLPFLLLAVISLTSCEDNAQKKLQPALLTVTVDPSWQFLTPNTWLVVNDEHGEVLDYRKLYTGTEFTFYTDREITGSIGITVVIIGSATDYGRYIGVKSYLELPKGKKLLLGSSELSGWWHVGAPVGTFSVDVAHPNTSLKSYFISDASGNSDGARTPYSYKTSFMGQVYESPTRYLLFAEDQASNLRYKIIDAPQNGAQYDFNFEELSEFDKTVEFVFPPTTQYAFAVYGDEPGQNSHFRLAGSQVLGTYNTYNNSSNEFSSLKGGYLNNFENPVTFLQLYYDTHTNEYNNVGLIPDGKIAWPSADDFKFMSKSIKDFETTSTIEFEYRLSRWNGYNASGGLTWEVYSPSGRQVFQKIPPNILSGILDLEETEFIYGGTKFFTSSSRPYDEVVEGLFEDKVKTPYSEVSILFGW